MPLKVATTSDARYSDAISDFPVMQTCLQSYFYRPSPRKTRDMSLELVSHLHPFLTNSSLLSELQAFLPSDTPDRPCCTLSGRLRELEPHACFSSRHSWDVRGRSASAFPSATRKLPQVWICGSSLSVLLISISSRLIRTFNKDQGSAPGGIPARSSGRSHICNRRSSALSSARLRSHVVPLALTAVESTANPSRSPNLTARDKNLDGSSIVVASHERMRKSMITSSFASSTLWYCLSDSLIFSQTSVLRALRLPHVPQHRLCWNEHLDVTVKMLLFRTSFQLFHIVALPLMASAFVELDTFRNEVIRSRT